MDFSMTCRNGQHRFLLRMLALVVLFIHGNSWANAQDKEDPLSWDRRIQGFFRQYCYKCHNEQDKNAEIDLKSDVDIRKILIHRENWEKAYRVLESREMPPEDAKQPTNEERDFMLLFLKKTLLEYECSTPLVPGPYVLRRLNRVEYDNSIRDLVGVDLKLAESFAPDATSFGFDNLGDSQSLSPVLIEQFHGAAKKIADYLLEPSAGRLPATVLDTETDAIEWIISFANKAFRKPVNPDYRDKLLRLYRDAAAKSGARNGVHKAIQAILISPGFLFRLEDNQPNQHEAYLVGHYEMASRLSYFLWSAPPDAELLECAARGQLLKRQSFRMMADPKAAALFDNFFGQWLSLRQLETCKPDVKVFPEFDDEIRSAMIEEQRRLVLEIVSQNRPITDLINADYTFVNAKLAKWYGLEESANPGWQRVQLSDRRRGGIFTTAGWLTLLSDPMRTNVPRRGNFLATYVMGAPAPPPPPNVPALEQSQEAERPMSMREMLEKHRQNPTCASCHAKMDPYGLALENFDAVGRWRERDAGVAIQATTTTLDGAELNGPVGLKEYLLKNKETFAKTMLKNLMIYAYGRGPVPTDECVLRDRLKRSEAGDWRMGDMIWAVIESTPFRYRCNPED
jgi:hypothetical protein